MTERRPVLAVVGAGPAGLAAALAAASRGVRVVLIDSASAMGGQFYRKAAQGPGAGRPQVLRHRRRTWDRLRTGLDAHLTAGRVTYLKGRHVWCVERESGGFLVHALLGPEQEESTTVHADGVLLATGGYEKVLPFPGWTLPGVVTAGGAQALAKAGLSLPGSTAVVAGSGPLLLPVDRARGVRSPGRRPGRDGRSGGLRPAGPDLGDGAREARRGSRVRRPTPGQPHHGDDPSHGGGGTR